MQGLEPNTGRRGSLLIRRFQVRFLAGAPSRAKSAGAVPRTCPRRCSLLTASVVVALVVVLSQASIAVADSTAIDWSGEDMSAAPNIVEALDHARSYWQAAPACPAGISVSTFDDPDPNVLARGEQPGCRIWLDRSWLATSPSQPVICTVITHEYGHLIGYGHDHIDSEHVMPEGRTPRVCYPLEQFGSVRMASGCRWPAWAYASPRVGGLYFDGRLPAARRAFRHWRRRHPRADPRRRQPAACRPSQRVGSAD